MVFPLRVILLVLAIVWSPAAVAEPASFPDLADALPGSESRTYGDLVRLVVHAIDNGDAEIADSGVIDVRHISGEDMAGVVPVSVEPLRIAAIPVRSGGKDRIALLINLGASEHEVSDFVILALFDIAGDPRLLDAAHVGFNRFTSFLEPSLPSVGVADDLLMTRAARSRSRRAMSASRPAFCIRRGSPEAMALAMANWLACPSPRSSSRRTEVSPESAAAMKRALRSLFCHICASIEPSVA